MRAFVIRNGIHMGASFIEVEHRPDGEHASDLKYAVPTDGEIPLGSEVEISVSVVSVPKEPEGNLEGREIGVGAQAPLVVPTSPIAPENAPADTAPSGQSSDEGIEQAAKEGEDVGASTSAKQGKLPKSFPHQAELEEAGVTTYAQVRALNGDYSEVRGIGEAKGKEIDNALNA